MVYFNTSIIVSGVQLIQLRCVIISYIVHIFYTSTKIL